MNRRLTLTALMALLPALATVGAQTDTTVPVTPSAAAERAFDRTPRAVVLTPGAAYGFFGPRDLRSLRPSPVVRIAIPPALMTGTDEFVVQRDGARVRVAFASAAPLERVYQFYRLMLREQGFEEVRVGRPEADEIGGAFRREESALTFTVEREGDGVYEVLFDLLPTARD